MVRSANFSCWTHSKTVSFIWLFSAFLFFTLFHMLLLNNSSSSSSSSSSTLNWDRRSNLYHNMERDLDQHGPAFLKHGQTSQSLSLSDIFTLNHGSVTPLLKPANPPVRANVLYMSPEFSLPIAEAVKNTFNPYFDKAIWFQNSTLYHFSMFHASHHIQPVPATKEEIEAEASSVQAVARTLCPLKIVLDRVVLTSTGVLLGCWQVNSGTDPITIRAKLKEVLPHAPQKQLYDAAILHTSFARLLGPPRASPTELPETSDSVQFFHDLVNRLNRQIRGFKAEVSELWYVEEFDLLALALNGRMNTRKYKLGCSRA
ncbi:hypothetical protein HN51_057272 [Arachis hypogaea]|uniref:uncharacterized protein LOC107623480 isoform X1 n=1 Tax=Arachis ipaensis TaxID=130454 RepID=UPI000A2B8D2A|nr:uncharacterized protein LOC107623480 isoform X1 [Arachis ipaensis]QHN80254.1 uncharacterized protein DS421_20g676750 [Arachis hypogaea]